MNEKLKKRFIIQYINILKKAKKYHKQQNISSIIERLRGPIREIDCIKNIFKTLHYNSISAESKEMYLESKSYEIDQLIPKLSIIKELFKISEYNIVIPSYKDVENDLKDLEKRKNITNISYRDKQLRFTICNITINHSDYDEYYVGDCNIQLNLYNEGNIFIPEECLLIFTENAHPHTRSDGTICTGDGCDIMGNALIQGRLSDFVDLVQTFLENYNPDSPLTEVAELGGTLCYNCEESCYDDSFDCSHCNHTFCSYCIQCCNYCEEAYCQEHISRCSECDGYVCENCMSCCAKCNENLCQSCIEKDDNSCTYCGVGSNLCSDCKSDLFSCCETCGYNFCDKHIKFCDICCCNHCMEDMEDGYHCTMCHDDDEIDCCLLGEKNGVHETKKV